MQIEQTALPGVLILTPQRFGDARGFFRESWNRRGMAEAGLDLDFVQDNHSMSAQVGTVRGLHFQSPPHAQDKLVRCGQGALFDVAVDIRKGLAHLWAMGRGRAERSRTADSCWCPQGFLHGFATRAPDTEIIYKCTDYYAPDCDGAVRFDDPDIGIDWGLSGRSRSCRTRMRAALRLRRISTARLPGKDKRHETSCHRRGGFHRVRRGAAGGARGA